MNRVWTDDELKFVRENAHKVKDKDLAAQLTSLTGRVVTLHSVRHVRSRLGIRKAQGNGVCRVVSRKYRRRPKYQGPNTPSGTQVIHLADHQSPQGTST